MTSGSELQPRPWALAAALLATALLVLYLALILGEGNNDFRDIAPWAGLMALGTVGAIAAATIRDPQRARRVMVGTAVLYGAIGFVSIFSIGIGFLVVAALLLTAANRLVEPN